MSKPGLLFVSSKLKDSGHDVTEQTFNKYYDEEHPPDMLAYEPKICDVAVRYKKTVCARPEVADIQYPYLALYPTTNPRLLVNGGLVDAAGKTRKARLLDGKDVYEFAEFNPMICEKVTGHDSSNERASSEDWARTLVLIYLETPDGLVDPRFSCVLDGLKGHRRTTLYKRIDGKHGALVLGEFDFPSKDVDVPTGILSLRRIFSHKLRSLHYEVDVYELLNVQGDKTIRL